jgi:ElaB/YqjD/DUF883 family membrane-anchored ribosome-binding protein
LRNTRRLRDDFGVRDTFATDVQTDRFARQAAEIAVGLQSLRDAAAETAAELSGPIVDALESSQSRVESLGGFVDNETKDAISRAGLELADVVSRAGEGRLFRSGVVQQMDRIRTNVQNVNQDLQFAELLKSQSEETQRALEAARQDAESSADRGAQLGRRPGSVAARDLEQGLLDIRRSFGRIAEETTGLVDFEGIRQAQQLFAQDAQRQAAPAIFNLADEVQNAVLQGPSRAALQATDVSTVQGASELNRLLRGDDSARNQNLVELQRQNNESLKELVNIAKANGAPPGIFD